MRGGSHLHKMSPPVSPYTGASPKRVDKWRKRFIISKVLNENDTDYDYRDKNCASILGYS